MTNDGANEHHKWQDLAQEASNEMDPTKLTQLVEELCTAIDEEKKPKPPTSEKHPGEAA
jgi:hypothetical protein